MLAWRSLAISGVAVEQIVNSTEYDLFEQATEQFDLAVMDRSHAVSRAGRCRRTAAHS